MSFKRNIKIFLAVVFLMFLFMPATGMAASAFVDTFTGYSANDILAGYRAIGGYDVVGNTTYAWQGGSLKVLNNTTGTTTYDWGAPTGYSETNSFVRYDGSGGVYVGFASGGSDDRIYHVNSSGAWSHVATLNGNFDMEIYGGNAYVSGLNGGSDNAIWLLDESGSNNHDLIIQTSGSSAGLSFDNSGNAYYASYDNLLYRWDATDVSGAIGGTNLTYGDGTKLADLELGAYDVVVDDAGNVIFNGNGYFEGYCYNALWNGTEGDGFNYDYIGLGSNGDYMDWFAFLDAEGDITEVDGGSLYQAESAWYGYYGIAEINAVPIPASVLLFGSGLLGLIGIRRKRAKSY